VRARAGGWRVLSAEAGEESTKEHKTREPPTTHARRGPRPPPHTPHRPSPPLPHQNSQDTAELIAYQEGRYGSYEYGRYGNPTTRTAEEKIRVLEGAEDCLVSSSGMNAATTMLLALVPAGGHVITTTDCYRRTRQFIQTVLPKMGVTATVIEPSDLGALEAALAARPDTALFFSESPTNPYLRCVDIPAIKSLCARTGTLVAIDSTFATPLNQRACALGADLVLHSATKYLAGHNDVLAGAIAGAAEPVAAVRAMHNVLGGTVDPHAAYLLLRGLKTLGLRVAHQNAAALEIARRLEAHPRVSRVHYPGLASHPDHAIAARQMTGFGGVVSFEVDADLWGTAAVVDAVRLPYIAPSLGGVESLIEQPTVISYWDQGPEGRAAVGIKDSLIRYSVGVEDVEDLWADLAQALERASG
jgi:cystathionine gamma-synthase